MNYALAGARAITSSLILMALVLILSPGVIFADEAEMEKPDTLSNKWAMQFEIERDFDLSSFEGATLSLKRITSPGKAWRIGLDLNAGTDNREQTDIYEDTLTSTNEIDSDRYAMTLSIFRVFEADPAAKLKFFWGFGPFGGHSFSKSNTRTVNTTGDSAGNLSKSRTWRVGISGIMGVEWFFSKNMSLLAEYGSSLDYSWNRTTQLTNYTTGYSRYGERINKSWNFDADAVKFGLSAYF